jgi:hypothetical protein
MKNYAYTLGDTYIGKYGIYCTAPVKQVNPNRWAVIAFSITGYRGERESMSKTIEMGCCKEKELAARVDIEVRRLIHYAVEEEDLKIDRITYYYQYKGEEAQAVEV